MNTRSNYGGAFEDMEKGRTVRYAMASAQPPMPEDELERLRSSGDVADPEDELAQVPAPLTLAPGTEPPSSVLARLRHDER